MINKKYKNSEALFIFAIIGCSFNLFQSNLRGIIYSMNIMVFLFFITISLRKNPNSIEINYMSKTIIFDEKKEYFLGDIKNIFKKNSIFGMMYNSTYILQFTNIEIYLYEYLYNKKVLQEVIDVLNSYNKQVNYIKKSFFLEGKSLLLMCIPIFWIPMLSISDNLFLTIYIILGFLYILFFTVYKLKPKRIYMENNTLFIDKEKIENIEEIKMKYGFFSKKLIIKTLNKKYVFPDNYFNNIEKFYKQNLKDIKLKNNKCLTK